MDPMPPVRCADAQAGDRKTTEQPLVLAVPVNFRVSGGPTLQEQVLFEGKKVTLGLVDA